MGLALVYIGEHYVFDLLIGGLYAVIAYAAARAIIRGLSPGGMRPAEPH
jgi:hypothetical protein